MNDCIRVQTGHRDTAISACVKAICTSWYGQKLPFTCRLCIEICCTGNTGDYAWMNLAEIRAPGSRLSELAPGSCSGYALSFAGRCALMVRVAVTVSPGLDSKTTITGVWLPDRAAASCQATLSSGQVNDACQHHLFSMIPERIQAHFDRHPAPVCS